MHTHYLLRREGVGPMDVPATILALWSRATPIVGHASTREQLARMVGPGPLADLLRSTRPIAVRSFPDAFEFLDLSSTEPATMNQEQHEYAGLRVGLAGGGDEIDVTRDGVTFDPAPSQRLWNHSPDGFEWGYPGSGPSQLALALVFDATGDRDLTFAVYQDYKREVVCCWPKGGWKTTAADVRRWIALKQRENADRLAAAEAAAGIAAADADESPAGSD